MAFQLVRLTRDMIKRFVGRDEDAVLQVERIGLIVGRLAQGGLGVVSKTSPWPVVGSLDQLTALVNLATESMSASPVGLRATCTDSVDAMAGADYGVALTGGGSETVPAFWDGSVWRMG
jgi:hypothetical protein